MRKINTIYISDVHLGSRFSKSLLLLSILKIINKSTNPNKIYLIGDFIDGWKLKRSWYWDKNASMVVRKLLTYVKKGTELVYVSGNHDEFLRGFIEDIPYSNFGGIRFVNSDTHLTAAGDKLLVIHGDQYDLVAKYSKWVMMFGSFLYEVLLSLNNWINKVRKWFKLPYRSFSKNIKKNVKKAVSYISGFETHISEHVKKLGYDGVVCGHIHQPESKNISGVKYYNTGDWVESCSMIIEWEDGQMEVLEYEKIMKLFNKS